MRTPRVLLAVALALLPAGLAAQEFRIEEAGAANPAALKAGVIAFNDRRGDPLADPVTGLIRFEEWARARPAEKRLLSLHPAYVEPVVNVSVNGVTKPYKEKLHVYVAEARFVLPKPPAGLDLARLATLPVLERIDPSIKHRPLNPAEIAPLRDPEVAHNQHPERRWCEPRPGTLCLASRYALEGKLPLGIRLANKLEEGGKKIAEHLDFQSELRLLGPEALDQSGLAKLTGLDGPVAAALEQNIFYVNQVMQFGKFLAVFQPHPTDPGKTVATTFMALAIESDVLEKKKEFERVPVLRNLVPAQVLVGKSSFNSGRSLSAGLPDYTRNRMKAIAALLAGS